MASSKGNLNRDIFGSCMYIGGKQILDRSANAKNLRNTSTRTLTVARGSSLNGVTARGNSSFKKNVTIDGNLTLRGQLILPNQCDENQDDAVEIVNNKKLYFDNLQSTYEANGSVSWSTFSSDQSAHKNKVVTLQQADFANGTLRVQQPCLLKLTENIAFNPNRPETWLNESDQVTSDFAQAAKLDPNRVLDWKPDQLNGTNNAQYFQNDVAFAYGLGFFAALAIETENVILDLNNYTFQQHEEHALQQRFFACIELADQPFMPFQGPSNFGAVLRSARNCYIKNGVIGLSSHHGIHGNDCDEIMVENVTFRNFEVAAISLNGSDNLYLRNLNIGTNRRDIPILGTYSAARFIQDFVQKAVDNGDDTAALNAAAAELKTATDATFNDIIFGNGSSVPTLFKNNSGLIDGTCYGLLFNPKGVAVNSFLADRTTAKANETSNIYLLNSTITDIKGRISEIVGITNPDSGMQVDTAGALLPIFNAEVSELQNETKYYYSGSVLSNVQVELTRVKKNIDDASGDSSYLGTLNIHEGIIEWKDDATKYFGYDEANSSVQLFDNGDSPVLIDGNAVVYQIKCNGDSMFHVNKGVIGLRVDGANTLSLSDCSISNIENVGESGSLLCGAYEQSHPAQNSTLVGYTGAQTFGVTLSAVNNVSMKNLQITNVSSANSRSVGIMIQSASTNTEVCNPIIGNVVSTAAFSGEINTLPNGDISACGLSVTSDCKNVCLRNLDITGISDQRPYPSKIIEVESDSVTIS